MTDTHATMTNARVTSSDRAESLSWLAHGGELALALKGDRAQHRDVIWQLLIEAVEIIDKVPDRERRWLTSGTRSSWKPAGLSLADLHALERIRFLSGMKPYDRDTTKYVNQQDDEHRALGVLEWMRWVNMAKAGEDRLRKAAIALARGGDTEVVARTYAPGRKSRPRQLAHEVRIRTAGLIMVGLERELGIVPVGCTHFSIQPQHARAA